jgi:hypothetical protein
MGLLTYYNLGPWNKFVSGYKAAGTGDSIFLTGNIKAENGDDNALDMRRQGILSWRDITALNMR